MNNHPYQQSGYYQNNATVAEVKMKCKFCNSLLLPINNSHNISASMDWLCIRCPNPVSYDSMLEEYSIGCEHNEHWYEIMYLPYSRQHLIFRLETNLVVQPESGSENYNSSRTLIKQFESERNITPTNAKDKLLTILTFS